MDGKSGATNLTITAPVLTAIKVTPDTPAITFVAGAGQKQQFKATGIYSDGSTVALTDTVTWKTSNAGVAAVGVGGLYDIADAGTSTISANASDITGSTLLTVNADKIPPTVTLINPSDGLVINTGTLTVSGNVDDVTATIKVYVDGVLAETKVPDGNAGFSINVNLAVGKHQIEVRATDTAIPTNTGSSGSRVVDYNPGKAMVRISSPADGAITKNPTMAVTGNFTNANSVTLYLNGVAKATLNTSPFTANIALVEGRNNIVVSGYHKNFPGNANYRSTSGIKTVTLDTTGPVITITSPATGTTVSTPGVTINGTVDDLAVKEVTLSYNGNITVPVAAGKFSQDIELTSPINNVSIWGVDALGNVTKTPATISITYDKDAPQVTVTQPLNDTLTMTGSVTAKGTVNDPSIQNVSIKVTTPAKTTTDTITAINQAFSKSVKLGEGNNTLSVTATDPISGKTGTSGNVRVKLDTTPPKLTISLSDPTDRVIVTVKSNEELNALPGVTCSNLGAVTMTQVSLKEWTGTITGFVDNTAYTITANGQDKALNNAVAVTAKFERTAETFTANATKTVNAGGAKLDITSNTTLNTNQTITVTQHTENLAENDAKAGNAAGVFLEIVASGDLTSSIDVIHVEVPYDEDEIFAAGLDEATLKLYTWDVATGMWKVEDDSGSNVTGNYVWANIHHLSKFGAFGTALTSDTPTTPTQPTGGYVPPVTTIDLTGTGMTSTSPLRINSEGTVQMNTTLTTTDEKVSYSLTVNMKVTNADGDAVLEGFGAVVVNDPPTSPEGTGIVTAYNMMPDGVFFDPAITLTMEYDPATLPEGMEESELYIAFWDGSQWMPLESTVDTVANVITAQVSHFTNFAIIGELPEEEEETVEPISVPETPANFTVTDLSISPTSIETGDLVTIKVLVTNTGEASGTYTVTLNLNGAAVETRDITLDGGNSQTVTFTTTAKTAGTYTVDVDGLTGSYTVTEPVVEVEEEEPVEEEPVETVETEPEPTGLPGWAWTLIIIAIVAVLGAAGWWFYRRRMA
jgi:hypothetical protein